MGSPMGDHQRTKGPSNQPNLRMFQPIESIPLTYSWHVFPQVRYIIIRLEQSFPQRQRLFHLKCGMAIGGFRSFVDANNDFKRWKPSDGVTSRVQYYYYVSHGIFFSHPCYLCKQDYISSVPLYQLFHPKCSFFSCTLVISGENDKIWYPWI